MSQHKKDQAGNVRTGEELPIEKLQSFLVEQLSEKSGELVVDQFPGGASNLTYLLTYGGRQMVLRRPPFGSKVKSAHDMGREHKVLTALSESYGKAPKPLIYTEDESIIGAPFYIMERVEGTILRKGSGYASTLGEKMIGDISESLVNAMVELHGLDYDAIGLGQLGRPVGYAERQVSGWTKRYVGSKTEEMVELQQVAKWLAQRVPKETDASLIHNDFKHDNVVLDSDDLTKVLALLDWEMCTVGDPLMDLGTTLAYWTDENDPPVMQLAGDLPSSLPGNPNREELIAMYEKKSGRKMEDPVFYYAYGLFKIAVVVQQIYYRYKMGHTQDKRFQHFNMMADGMGKLAYQAIQKNKIIDLQ